MSTWDFDRSVEMQCLCGKGTFEVRRYVPDHGYSTSSVDYRPVIHCPICAVQNAIVARQGGFEVVNQVALANKKQLEDQANAASRQLIQSPQAQNLKDQLVIRIRQEPTVAAKYRLLVDLQSYETEGNFRRNWGGEDKWLRLNFRVSNFAAFGNLVGGLNPALQTQLQAHDALDRQAKAYQVPALARLPSF